MSFFLLGLGGFVLSYIGVVTIRRWALRRNLLDIPNDRSMHVVPTPRGGGLAIVFATLIGLLTYMVVFPDSAPSLSLGYVIGASAIAVVSWIDDRHSLPNRVRFLVHFLASIIGIAAFGYWREVAFPLIGTIYLGWLGLLLTVIWIIGLTNAYNFMDGIDGIAGCQAVVGGIGWLLLGWLSGQPLVMVLGLLMASSSLGFLAFNWPPAKIFMGDVGSAFLGYTFAMLPLICGFGHLGWSGAALSGFLLLWPFITDTTLTLLRRLLHGERVFEAHRSHIYQRLVIAGHSNRTVTLLYAGLSSIGVIAAVTLRLLTP